MKSLNFVHGDRDRNNGGALASTVFLGILIALAGTAVPAYAAFTPISTCGFVISASGDYAVTADLTCLAGDAIDVHASRVSLKLNGHTITTTSGTPGNGIDIRPSSGRLNHVAVQGPGLIKNFKSGINILNTDYSQVDLITASQNSTGLSGGSSVGDSVTYLTIGGNQFVANKSDGADLWNSINSVVQYNDLSGNGGSGLAILATSYSNTVNNNVSSGNHGSGIVIKAVGSRVYANVTNGNVEPGIAVLGTGNSIFNNSSSVGNEDFDLADVNPTCDSNVWGNNVFFNRNHPCIR